MQHRGKTIIAAGLRFTSTLPTWSKEVFRFLIVGGLNTLIGYGGYLLLLHWLHYEMAYAISYVAGVVVSYVLSTLFVFRQPIRLRSALRYPLVYITQFLLSLVLLKTLIELLHVSAWLAPLLVTVITIPVTFLMSRAIVRGR